MVRDEEIQKLAERICDHSDCDNCFADKICVYGEGKANGIFKYLKRWLHDNGETTEVPREG